MPFKKDLATSDHLLCPEWRVGSFVEYIPQPSGLGTAEMWLT